MNQVVVIVMLLFWKHCFVVVVENGSLFLVLETVVKNILTQGPLNFTYFFNFNGFYLDISKLLLTFGDGVENA